jgi:peptide subunit release factor 1 (eRF1)
MIAKSDSVLSEGAYTLCGDDERGYDFVTVAELQPLRELHLSAPGVLSLYVDITPQRLVEIPLERRVEALLKAEEEKLTEKWEVQRFQQAAQHVMEHLSFEYRPSGRGLAVFCAPEQALRRVYHLPVGGEDKLTWADHAYLRPLLMLMDEYERYGVVLVDRERARFFLYYLNEVAEYGLALKDETPPRTRDREPGALKHLHWLEEQYKQHFRSVAKMVMRLDEHERWPWLALGGTDENTSALMKELPKTLQERVAGVFHAPVTTNLVEVRDEVTTIERRVEEKVEAERVEAVITNAHKGQGATLGLADTLGAVQQGRVQTLVTRAGFRHKGWRCQNCGGLVADLTDQRPPACPYCEGALIAEADIIDLAMGVVAEQGGMLEVVRGPMAERLLNEGPVGALLRY